MSKRHKVVFYLSCDECPPNKIETSEPTDDFSLHEALAQRDGWALEEDLYDVCPECLKRRRQRECGNRPQGHKWRKTWFAGEAGEDGWIFIEMTGPGGTIGYWQRHCLDCSHHDRVEAEAMI